MEAASKETFLKGLLDWMQNLAISMGLFAAAAALYYQDWALNEHWGAADVSGAMGVFSLAYVTLATAHFIRTHAPSNDHPRRQGLWLVMAIVVLATIAECCAIGVMHYAAWEHKQHGGAADHPASSSSQPSAIR